METSNIQCLPGALSSGINQSKLNSLVFASLSIRLRKIFITVINSIAEKGCLNSMIEYIEPAPSEVILIIKLTSRSPTFTRLFFHHPLKRKSDDGIYRARSELRQASPFITYTCVWCYHEADSFTNRQQKTHLRNGFWRHSSWWIITYHAMLLQHAFVTLILNSVTSSLFTKMKAETNANDFTLSWKALQQRAFVLGKALMLNKKKLIRNLIQKPLIVKKKMHKMIRMNNAKWSKMKAENATIGKVLLRQSLLLVYHFQAFSWAEVERVRSDLLTVRFNYVFRIFTKTRRWMSDWFHTWRCVFTRRSRRRRCRCRHFNFFARFRFET